MATAKSRSITHSCARDIAALCLLASVAQPDLPEMLDAPADSLPGKLIAGETAQRLPSGVSMSRRYVVDEHLGAVLVQATVKSTLAAPVSLARIPVVDLTFEVGARAEDAAYSRLTYRHQQWYGSTFWTGPGWTRVGEDWQHPGEAMPSVRCFHAPRDGPVTIGGTVRKLHLDGDGVRVMIRHGVKEIWRAQIDGKDAVGLETGLTLDVQRGDRIRFVVHQRGTISCDTTYWDPVITYADGESSRASESFSTTRQGVGGWFYEMQGSEETGPYRKLTYHDEKWYGSTFWGGSKWTRVGKDWHHPGDETPSVRGFRAPLAGQITLSGRVRKLHLAGDGVCLSIRHGAKQVWRAEIDGEDATGVEPDLQLDVKQGDVVRFIVHKRGSISCDTTHWDPVIAYADGESFQASRGFSTTKQPHGEWFYESLAQDLTPPKALHVLGPGLEYRRAALTEGHSFEADSRDALPFLVLDDPSSKSGVAVALDTDGQWSFDAGIAEDGLLRATLCVDRRGQPIVIGPGQELKLPCGLIAAYEGPWTAIVARLGRLARPGTAMQTLGDRLRGAHQNAIKQLGQAPDLGLLVMTQAEWWQDDRITDTQQSYAAAVQAQLAKARKLARALREGRPDGLLRHQAARLAELTATTGGELTLAQWRRVYQQTRLVKRAVALANPLLDFGKLLVCKRLPPSYSHLVMQYYGWRARPGGGLFVLDDPGYSLACRDILDGRLQTGSVLEPRLSWDAGRILFSYVRCPKKPFVPTDLVVNEEGPDEGYYHIHEVNVDGTGLRQLTGGPYDDTMPTYLPDGGIAFCSTRRKGYARCFGPQFSRRWDTYTVHRMNADGSAVRTLSFNDVSEWFPTVSADGRLIYARWDYIDRDAVTHQNLWAMRPDGTDPMAVWGNASAKPHCMFQAKPIPGSRRIVFVASAHHTIAGGPVCVLTPGIDANHLSAVERVTPEPFPEAEGWSARGYYDSPWPLSEDYFLVAYSPTPLVTEGKGANEANALGIYLLDTAGNRELIYRDPHIGTANATPLQARPTPPVIASSLPADPPPTGEMMLMDVTRGLGDVPRGAIKQLRIIQIFPKTTPLANQPPIGLAGEENGRAILGTVPVQADGSARFEVPACKPVLFQALDEDGLAYQTMRSLTYLQPGETVSCVGCHEPQSATPENRPALATKRKPSRIDPGALGGEPFSYPRVVQPVLDRHCIRCHGPEEPAGGMNLTGKPRGPYSESYWSLCGGAQDFWGTLTNPQNAAKALVPRFGARNQIQLTPPGGTYGARGSRLIKLLRAGHQKVRLGPHELAQIGAWIDCNAIFYGVYDPAQQAKQRAGERVEMPAVQ